MYTNIQKLVTINIITDITNITNYGIDENVQKEIIHIIKTVTEHNYFQFDQQYHKLVD
jgi:hypothetical protein